ncbi:xylulokinase [Kushneria sinocarnis]|uniref:Xylulose kinase n=1 Tax=Kushneria sinocarnis TaxID=595502 RepID=A0A420WTN8_9GAMM|nr:xylulokinase [Kushneria sinocarnis]RKQ96881.1 xylulokinase [Kushneria sinocarnis]
MYIGVDCGTQSTKVVVFDPERRALIGEASSAHELISAASGRREQQPAWWIEAFETAFHQAIERAGISAGEVRAIGVSGQQHGMVALDEQGEPVYPGKLWNDTEASHENEMLIEALGGEQGCLDRLGIIPQAGYTAPKIAWLREHHREAYDRIATLLLPHDYLNFHLTGERTAEYGDASGTAYFDTRRREWAPDVLAKVAPELDAGQVLPRLVEPDQPAGRVRREVAERLGLGEHVVVSSGGGDNMMGAIGTGNITPGAVTMSLGTSGTIYGCSTQPTVSRNGLVANFCGSHGGWLPLICTMNVTSATNQIRELTGHDVNAFNAAVERAPIGAEGVRVMPFFNGERVPMLPQATGSFLNLSSHNFSGDNLCRAVMEGATFGLRYGLDLLAEFDIRPKQLRLVGGGANSRVWRQMVADVMNVELVCPVVGEAAALGAALQAQWCERRQQGETIELHELCEQAVDIDESTLTIPDEESAGRYREVYRDYLKTLRERYPQGMAV